MSGQVAGGHAAPAVACESPTEAAGYVNADSATIDELERQYAKDKDLRALPLRDGNYAGVQVPNARLDGMDLHRVVFQDADLREAKLVGVQARRSFFIKANLAGADLRNGDYRGAQLNSADLTGADVRGCRFSPDTNMSGATVTGLKIDRQALRSLSDKHGGLTPADLAQVELHDDRIKLMTGFGGFLSLLHLVFVVIFLLPYVAFIIRSYVAAQLTPCIEPLCISLREAIWQYVRTGGRGTETDPLALWIFGFLLAYNILRATLVYKAQALALADEAIGLPTNFSLRGYWWLAYQVCFWLFFVNMLLIAFHTYRFLDTPVSRLSL